MHAVLNTSIYYSSLMTVHSDIIKRLINHGFQFDQSINSRLIISVVVQGKNGH